MPVTIKTNSGGGSVTLDAGTGSLDTTLTLPNTSGTILQSGTAVTAAQGGTGLTSPGTSGNVLTSDGTNWTSAVPASASLTLLATLTTTSGTTQSATGLATTYKNLLIVLSNVQSTATSTALLVAASTNNGSSYGATSNLSAGSATNLYGPNYIWLANSSLSIRPLGSAISGNALSNQIATLSAAPINALQFSWNTGPAFNSGTIYIYGWN